MDWTDIPWANIAMIITLGIGVPMALRARKKGGPRKAEELLQHLKDIGVDASLVTEGIAESKVGIGRGSGQRCEGTFKINARNIDYINVISVAGQYGVNYYIDYLVQSTTRMGATDRKRTKLSLKKDSFLNGKVIDVTWQGDHYLSQVLNLDYKLKDSLLMAELAKLAGSLTIFPEPKYNYARIRTIYLLPSTNLLMAVNYIANHIRSEW